MATRGIIAIENPDKTVSAIYVHFDMYLDGAGITLTSHYNTQERVEQLLALGNLSSLGDRISKDDPEADARDTCIAYHRDYGEAEQPVEVWNSAEELLNNVSDRYWAEYVYLYRNGEWVYDTPSRKYNWKSVKQALEE